MISEVLIWALFGVLIPMCIFLAMNGRQFSLETARKTTISSGSRRSIFSRTARSETAPRTLFELLRTAAEAFSKETHLFGARAVLQIITEEKPIGTETRTQTTENKDGKPNTKTWSYSQLAYPDSNKARTRGSRTVRLWYSWTILVLECESLA